MNDPQLLHIGPRFAPALRPGETANEVYHRLSLARAYIDECFDHPLDLDQIAAQAFFSPYHFLRLFAKAFNKTPHQYLTEKRLEKAKHLLTTSDLSVTEICFEVGFQSLGSFSSLFHKQVGYPPMIYRTTASRRVLIPVLYPQISFPCCFLMMYGAKELYLPNGDKSQTKRI